jgi:hypothetical protein
MHLVRGGGGGGGGAMKRCVSWFPVADGWLGGGGRGGGGKPFPNWNQGKMLIGSVCPGVQPELLYCT